MLMRAGLSGRQMLAVPVAFSVFYAAFGLIGASDKLRTGPCSRHGNGQGHPGGLVRAETH